MRFRLEKILLASFLRSYHSRMHGILLSAFELKVLLGDEVNHRMGGIGTQ